MSTTTEETVTLPVKEITLKDAVAKMSEIASVIDSMEVLGTGDIKITSDGELLIAYAAQPGGRFIPNIREVVFGAIRSSLVEKMQEASRMVESMLNKMAEDAAPEA